MDVFATILPILIISFAGYFLAKKKYLSQIECRSISKLVFTYIIPLLLFINSAKVKIPENFNVDFLFAFYIPALLIYILSAIIGKFYFKYDVREQSVFGMGAAYSNATIIGIPVCLYVLGSEALLPLFLIISIHNLTLFTMGILIAESKSISLSGFLKSIQGILKQLITSPITGSLIVGGMVNLLEIPIYSPLQSAIELMSTAAVPMALFVLGTSMNNYKIHGHIKPALIMVMLKIVAFPLLVWIFSFHIFSLEPLWASTALLTSAMPIGVSAYIFSQKYASCEASIAAGIIISTITSIVTLSATLGYINNIALYG